MTQSPLLKADEELETTPVSEPTWFLSPLDRPANDELAELYRLRHQSSQPPSPAGVPLHELIATRQPLRETAYPAASVRHRGDVRTRSRTPLSLPKTYALAAAVAVAAGAASGFAAASLVPAAAAFLVPGELAVTNTARLTGVTEAGKKPVPTALLLVSDTEGLANTPIPLMLTAEPAVEGQDIIVKISGVPESAYLTAGQKIAEGAWQVSPPELMKLNLVSRGNASQRIDLAVAGFEAETGDMLTPIKEVTVSVKPEEPSIMPAAAPPPLPAKQVRQ